MCRRQQNENKISEDAAKKREKELADEEKKNMIQVKDHFFENLCIEGFSIVHWLIVVLFYRSLKRIGKNLGKEGFHPGWTSRKVVNRLQGRKRKRRSTPTIHLLGSGRQKLSLSRDDYKAVTENVWFYSGCCLCSVGTAILPPLPVFGTC